jgi:hypothetical protein
MRTVAKWLVSGLFVALLAVVVAPALLAESGEQAAGFYTKEPLLVGSVSIQPGVYRIRSLALEASRNVLVVTNEDQTKVLSIVLASPYQVPVEEFTTAGKLVYDDATAANPNTLRRWVVANASVGWDIAAYPPSTKVATGSQSAITTVAVLR